MSARLDTDRRFSWPAKCPDCGSPFRLLWRGSFGCVCECLGCLRAWTTSLRRDD